jgi:hypothetical protein
VEREAREQRTGGSRTATALLRSELDPVRVDRQKREFGRDEESIDENEKDDSKKSERGVDDLILL